MTDRTDRAEQHARLRIAMAKQTAQAHATAAAAHDKAEIANHRQQPATSRAASITAHEATSAVMDIEGDASNAMAHARFANDENAAAVDGRNPHAGVNYRAAANHHLAAKTEHRRLQEEAEQAVLRFEVTPNTSMPTTEQNNSPRSPSPVSEPQRATEPAPSTETQPTPPVSPIQALMLRQAASNDQQATDLERQATNLRRAASGFRVAFTPTPTSPPQEDEEESRAKDAIGELSQIAARGCLPACYEDNIHTWLADFWSDLSWDDDRDAEIHAILADPRFPEIQGWFKQRLDFDMDAELRAGYSKNQEDEDDS